MARLSLSLLGPLQVVLDGTPVTAFAYDKVRALLAYLAVEAGRPHRREALAGLLWPEQEESAARHSLSQALWSLRRTLGDHCATPPVLLLTRDTVEFNQAADSWLDIAAFTALLEACDRHQHRRTETCTDCARRLEQAVALYRGDLLAQFSVGDSPAFEEWALGRREWLHQRALAAFARLVDYHEQRGAYDQACDYARQQLALDPWREPAHRQLMRALALSGERGAALAQYERCRRALAQELGCEPEAATTVLYRLIRDGGMAPHSARITPALAAPRSQLPPQPGPLVGREGELAELGTLLADPACRLVTLVGPGGVGKTRLAIRVAADHREAFAEGVVFVSLAPLRSADQLAPAIADALALTWYEQRDPQGQLLDWLRERELLIVLDNFEHLLEGAPLLAAVLRDAPGVRLLVTSRERLELSDEWVFAVEGLGVPAASETGGIEDYGAVRLFVQRARRAAPHFELCPHERPHVAHICRLVGGMPLAIELAAAWVPVLPCAEIAQEIGRGLDFLATSLRDVPERHRSMRAVFDHSWTLLAEDQRDVFRQLSAFRGGFQRAAAQEVAGASLSTLSALLGKSFVRRLPTGRYELHELLRQYAEDQLEACPQDARQARERHCRYYLAFLAQREGRLRGHDQTAALGELGAEIENVRAAWRWASEQGHAGLIAQASDALWSFYLDHGRMLWEADDTFGGAAAALGQPPGAGEGPRTERELALGKVLAAQGGPCFRLGQLERARSLLGESVALLRRLDAPRELAFALNQSAAVLHLQGEYPEEQRLLREGIALAQGAGDRWCAAYSLNDLGMATLLLGDAGEARRLCEESLTIFREIGDRRGTAFTLNNLGEIAAQRGHHAEAERLHREGLALRRGAGDQWGIAYSLSRLGIVARLRGDAEEARARLLEALRIASDSRALPVVLDVLVELARLLAGQGQWHAALDLVMQVLEHPARNRQAQEKGQRLLAELRPQLAPPAVEAARESAAASTVEGVVQTLLAASEAAAPA